MVVCSSVYKAGPDSMSRASYASRAGSIAQVALVFLCIYKSRWVVPIGSMPGRFGLQSVVR